MKNIIKTENVYQNVKKVMNQSIIIMNIIVIIAKIRVIFLLIITNVKRVVKNIPFTMKIIIFVIFVMRQILNFIKMEVVLKNVIEDMKQMKKKKFVNIVMIKNLVCIILMDHV